MGRNRKKDRRKDGKGGMQCGKPPKSADPRRASAHSERAVKQTVEEKRVWWPICCSFAPSTVITYPQIKPRITIIICYHMLPHYAPTRHASAPNSERISELPARRGACQIGATAVSPNLPAVASVPRRHRSERRESPAGSSAPRLHRACAAPPPAPCPHHHTALHPDGMCGVSSSEPYSQWDEPSRCHC